MKFKDIYTLGGGAILGPRNTKQGIFKDGKKARGRQKVHAPRSEDLCAKNGKLY